ncbi:MAG: alginate lyase family protein [Chloroflexota bacterium]|nr:alginate lyase family protein [Chloroflexota bacterium]
MDKTSPLIVLALLVGGLALLPLIEATSSGRHGGVGGSLAPTTESTKTVPDNRTATAAATRRQPAATTGAPPTASHSPPDVAGADYLLISGADLMAQPTGVAAWEDLEAVADAPPGRADLTDQDNRHGVRALAAALVFARTGDEAYEAKARQAIIEAIGTEREGADNSILALGRQLAAYVLAADFIRLSGDDDREFRSWLSEIRTRELGGHGRWRSLTATHEDSINNWGAFAGASRIAASLYLGDTIDVARAATVLRGFLGDRDAWNDWEPLNRHDVEWACDPDAYTPINPPCWRSGINLDGAIVADISRAGGLGWPPGRTALIYTLESLQGLAVQAELLHQNGYDAWEWSDRALMRAALFVDRADGWNIISVGRHVPWLFNERYALKIPEWRARYGRLLGYTDWLYRGD